MIKQRPRDQEKGLAALKYAAEAPLERNKTDREFADRFHAHARADADKELAGNARSPEQQPDDDER